MRAFLGAIVIFVACASASAQERQLVIVGAGASPCADILKSYQAGPKAIGLLYLSYAQGFWTGQNAMFMQARAPLKNLSGDSDTQLKGLMMECSRRPSEDFGIIIRDFFYKLPSLPNPKTN